ncbi:hypothetical protein [Sinomonas atrocyanea]|jgi:hypothetical protein|uniref:hypothetical protein n=1 Tax=Sinomonas atrocyanea TaxID=37927 RepID=UPI00285CDCBE|nr:hypothetical protein [Sinomonas atrocyanea]MDR6620822.1 hypothetical protein [Sinomonas atrocyanea]
MKPTRPKLKLKGLSLLAAAALAGGTSLLAVGPASAAGPCGAGYAYIGSHPIVVPSFSKDYRYGKPGTKTGSIDVYWNSSLRRNCSVAYAYGSTYGVQMYRLNDIGVYPSIAPDDESRGYYSYYAGPDYTRTQPVGGQCISVGAGFGPSDADKFSWGFANYPDVHC